MSKIWSLITCLLTTNGLIAIVVCDDDGDSDGNGLPR